MASISKVLYIGVTNNLERRVIEHREGSVSGFSEQYRCKKLVYYEFFDDIHIAIAREKQLKRWGRQKKINLIEKENPHWADLMYDRD